MIHLLFCNILYPCIDRAAKIEVISVENRKYPCISINAPQFSKTLVLDLCSNPNVLELINRAEPKDRAEVARSIVYKTFQLFCQRFSGKIFSEGKLVDVENAVFNLDAALFSLYKVEDEPEDLKEIKQ